jgi:hypothetical protein
MKRKIIALVFMLMLLTSFFTVAKNVNYSQTEKIDEEIDTLFIDEDNAPIWNQGDIWTYKVDTITVDLSRDTLYVSLNAKINELPIEVQEVFLDSYKLKFKTPISGDFDFVADLGAGPINITGELKSSTIDGYIIVNKTDLGLRQAHIVIDGRISMQIIEIPQFPFQVIPPIPIPMTITLDLDLTNPIPLIDFPINTSKFWGIPATNISIEGTIQSIWLVIVKIVNDIIRIPGIIDILATLLKLDSVIIKQFSDILYNITPVLDVKYLLNEYLNGNVFNFSGTPPLLYCISRDNITTPAGGPFNSYNITVGEGFGNMYYCPDVGNWVKISGNFREILPFISDLNAELISYSYNPP